jgi:2-phospho-L-lactate guanylyltransferase (CobY/MobA/RfbA family)
MSEPTQREMLTVIMLKDVLDGIEHHFGKGGLELVTDFATMQNRARESNRLMDELERLYGPLPSPQETEQ